MGGCKPLPRSPIKSFSSSPLTRYNSSRSSKRSTGIICDRTDCSASFSFCDVTPWLQRKSQRIWRRSAMRSSEMMSLVGIMRSKVSCYLLWVDDRVPDGALEEATMVAYSARNLIVVFPPPRSSAHYKGNWLACGAQHISHRLLPGLGNWFAVYCGRPFRSIGGEISYLWWITLLLGAPGRASANKISSCEALYLSRWRG